jgi:ribonuclease HI
MNTKNTFRLYTDGSYHKELKVAGIGGYLLDSDDKLVFDFSEKLENTEDFGQHENLALLYGLKKALQYGVQNIECYSDAKGLIMVCNRVRRESCHGNPLLLAVFDLKPEFENINFHHLLRKNNKLADYLAGKSLREHKNTLMPSKPRSFFKNRQKDLLHIPNLVCQEDFEEKKNLPAFEKLCNKPHEFIVVDMKSFNNSRALIKTYHVTKNPQQGISYSLLFEENCALDQIFYKSLSMLDNSLKQVTSIMPGIMFHCDKNLSRIDLVLRKRSLIHKEQPEVIHGLQKTCEKFDKIVLHHDEKLTNLIYLQENAKNAPTEDFLRQEQMNQYLQALKELGEEDYYIGKNPEIESYFNLPDKKKNDIAEIQKKYFGAFVKIAISSLNLLGLESEIAHDPVALIKEHVSAQGVKFRL